MAHRPQIGKEMYEEFVKRDRRYSSVLTSLRGRASPRTPEAVEAGSQPLLTSKRKRHRRFGQSRSFFCWNRAILRSSRRCIRRKRWTINLRRHNHSYVLINFARSMTDSYNSKGGGSGPHINSESMYMRWCGKPAYRRTINSMREG